MPTWQQRVQNVDARDPGSIYRFLLQQFHEGIAAREQVDTGVIEKAEVLPEGVSADFMRKVGQFLRASAEIRQTARTSGSSQPYADIASETVELFFGERVTVETSPQFGDDGSIQQGNLVEREVDFSDADRKAYLSLINMQYYLLDIATSVATSLNQAEAAHQEFSEKKAETMERTPKVHLGISTVGKSVFEQTKDVLKQIDEILAKAGTDKTRILKANIWLTDIATFGDMNKAWDAWVVPGKTPARATVEAKLAAKGYDVEIMIEAAV